MKSVESRKVQNFLVETWIGGDSNTPLLTCSIQESYNGWSLHHLNSASWTCCRALGQCQIVCTQVTCLTGPVSEPLHWRHIFCCLYHWIPSLVAANVQISVIIQCIGWVLCLVFLNGLSHRMRMSTPWSCKKLLANGRQGTKLIPCWACKQIKKFYSENLAWSKFLQPIMDLTIWGLCIEYNWNGIVLIGNFLFVLTKQKDICSLCVWCAHSLAALLHRSILYSFIWWTIFFFQLLQWC